MEPKDRLKIEKNMLTDPKLKGLDRVDVFKLFKEHEVIATNSFKGNLNQAEVKKLHRVLCEMAGDENVNIQGVDPEIHQAAIKNLSLAEEELEQKREAVTSLSAQLESTADTASLNQRIVNLTKHLMSNIKENAHIVDTDGNEIYEEDVKALQDMLNELDKEEDN